MDDKKKQLVDKIVNVVLNVLIVIFCIVLLISIYTGLQVKVLKQKYANFFGYSLFEVQTPSMEDTISVGDWIIVKITKKANIKDIITYEKDGDFITHRVVEIYNGTYITRGDANTAKDEPIDQSQIIGKTVKILPGFGILRKTIFNPPVIIALLITLILFSSLFKNKNKEVSMITKAKEIFLDLKNKFIKTDKKDKKEDKVEKLEIKDEEKKIEKNEIESSLEKIEIPSVLDEKPNEPKVEEEIVIEEVLEVKKDSDDLEKTSIFRVIPVDVSELDDTLLEIAKNEMRDEEKVVVEEEEIIELPAEEKLTDIDFELLKENTPKGKNIIDGVLNIKREELSDLVSVLLAKDKVETNEVSIKNAFIDTFIYARYYNYFGAHDLEYKGRGFVNKIENVIKITGEELIRKYNGPDSKYTGKVRLYANAFKIIANLDYAKDAISELKAKKEFYNLEINVSNPDWTEEEVTSATEEILDLQKSYAGIIRFSLKKLETDKFYIDYQKVTGQKNMYAIDLKHNIAFNKIYSDYIIDKTYLEGVIAEDKLSVLFSLLSAELLSDMIATNFDKKYVLYLPSSLYKKEKKIWRFLKMIEDEYAKSHIILLIQFNDLVESRSLVKSIKQEGYRFALAFTEESEVDESKRNNLYMVDKIFINKKDENFEQLDTFVPSDLKDNVIYDDVASKIYDMGGE